MAQTIRLCTWNIQLGWHLQAILGAVRSHPDFAGLDLLALQEASIHSDREDAREIAAALGTEYQSFQVTAHFLGKFAQANALVWNTSRMQVLTTDIVGLPRAREVQLSRAERTFLYALPQQQRISLMIDGALGHELVRVYVAHLDVLGIAHKWEQFRRILGDARARQPAANLTILAGDLNTYRIRSRPNWANMIAAAELDGFQDLTSEIRWTHHTLRRVRFRQKLDAIFVRRTRPLRYRSWSLDVSGSDHIPVFAEITLE
ncbi:MAG: endonuclease/exonuclease/phosphatase family protein [Chloroflexi bacterium]|nr:endonuclease/exonuclease/phosphatase family protein [Chloroflexota bacterium]